MNGRTFAVMAVILIALSGATLVACNSEADAPITVSGEIVIIDNQSQFRPVEGIKVSFLSSSAVILATTQTDAEGRFECQVLDSLYFVEFEMHEHADIRTTADCLMPTGDHNRYYVDLAKATVIGEKYNLGREYTVIFGIMYRAIHGTVSGHVANGNVIPLQGAEVQIVSETGAIQKTVTDNAGYYSLDCTPGSNQVMISCRGFEPTSFKLEGNDLINVTLEEKIGWQYGVDYGHMVELATIIILLLLALLFIAIYDKNKKDSGKTKLINDLQQKK